MAEPVIVGAIFGSCGLRPAWFVWGGRKIRVERTTFQWQENRGSDTLHHFTVSDGCDLFELVLDLATLTWRLHNVQVSS